MEHDEMIVHARGLVSRCHCPYSGFRVAAVIEDSMGGFHAGVNVENSSLGLSICAERTAVASAVTAGVSSFRGILIHSPDGFPVPCGACRQFLREFCGPDFPLTVSHDGERIETFLLGDLLPCEFTLAPPRA